MNFSRFRDKIKTASLEAVFYGLCTEVVIHDIFIRYTQVI